jgi:predicted ATP-grasp superfamily ATP-dependent carboligase
LYKILFCLTLLFGLSVVAQEKNESYKTTFHKASSAIKIDGIMDENFLAGGANSQ